MMGATTLRIEPVAFADAAAQALVADVQAEYTVLYGGPDDTPLEDGVFDPPAGAFFLGYDEQGTAVAMGGWRRRPDVSPWGLQPAAEIKRMYVVRAARRRGFARAVLDHLERTAAEAGAAVMVLETGTMQPEAIEMYTRAGYQGIDAYGHYAWSPSSRYFGKPLSR